RRPPAFPPRRSSDLAREAHDCSVCREFLGDPGQSGVGTIGGMGLTWRPIAPDDVAAVAALVNAVAEADGTGEVTTEESLRESLRSEEHTSELQSREN